MKRAFDPQKALSELVRVASTDRFEIRIDYGGTWYYKGSKIERFEMVKLFATALHRASDRSYWLITPFEQGRIEVENTPFVITSLEAGETLQFTDNLDRCHPLDENYKLVFAERSGQRGEVPHLLFPSRVEARLLSPVYYELADLAVERDGRMGIPSAGRFFDLGPAL